MNWLDILIIVIMVFVAFTGLRTGIIKAVLTLAGLVIGVLLAGQHYVSLSGWLSSYITQENLAKIAAFAIILIATLIAASVLASILRRVISWIMLGWVDKLGGAVFGLAIGATVCGALLATIVNFPFFDIEGVIRQSSLASILLDRFPLLLALLPEEFDAVRSFFQ